MVDDGPVAAGVGSVPDVLGAPGDLSCVGGGPSPRANAVPSTERREVPVSWGVV
jgi:hypothetical protein